MNHGILNLNDKKGILPAFDKIAPNMGMYTTTVLYCRGKCQSKTGIQRNASKDSNVQNIATFLPFLYLP
jgi:hypothetical protein